MNSNSDSYSMCSRQPFLSALDYIFYIELHIEKEQIEFNEEESLPSFRTNNSEIPKLTEILKKLGLDLQSAFDSFLIEFIENEGIYCLLNLLRLCLNRQQTPTTNRTTLSEQKDRSFRCKERHNHLKRALNDEYDSLLCLQFAVKRNTRAIQKMVSHKTGLSSLAACIVSNFTKSRLIALQILSKVCDQTEGVSKVLEALSTTRIIFGESVRFKFLVSMVNSANSCSANGIECNALSLLNTLIIKTDSYAERIRLQCEMEEAGLDLNYLENILIEKNIPKDEMIWTEIQRFRNQYIDVNDKFVFNRHSFGEKHELKEEVEILHRALNKLEEDKINLMTIERELKEKCEDLEQEVDHLKSKFNVLIPVKNENQFNQQKSESGATLSTLWPDSHLIANKQKSDKNNGNEVKIEVKNDYNYDQNMKNEEEFIYVPAIHPPPNFAQYVEREQQMNDSTQQNNFNLSKRFIKCDFNGREERDSDRPHTQNLWPHKLEVNDCSRSNYKPTVVDVHPKHKYIESILGADRDNYETILHWNYKTDSESDHKQNHKNSKMSISMNQINAIKDNFKFKRDFHNLTHFSNSQNNNNFSFDSQLKSISNITSKQNLSQSNECLYSRNNKKKNIRSSLQSYFFSGCSTLKHNKKYFHSIDNMEESPKSFPLPKTYKKNFIVRGHGNCGLYSGQTTDKTSHKNLSDDLKSAPDFDKLSALVHKEIADATKDISAWL